MNRTLEDYMDLLFNGTNHTWDLYNYYDDLDAYAIESFHAWEGTVKALKIINKVFVILSIILCVLDLFLLVTAFSASARERSASWYLYHLIFVTILRVTFSLPMLEGDIHGVFGTCMFFSFTHWTLYLVYNINLVLMNIEILATIFASHPRWKSNQNNRFVISMTATWISSILLSVVVMFFGREEHKHLPVCFHLNDTSKYIGLVVNDWIPALVGFALTITGLVLFIRAKRGPENYRHMTENQNSLRLFNEWFACFMTWNLLIVLTDGLLFEAFQMFFQQGFLADIIIQMIVFQVRTGLPLSCLMLGPVRETCTDWVMTGVQFATGITRSSKANPSEMQPLDMEACK